MAYSSKRKNIAIILGRLSIGGAEKQASLLSQELYKNGYNVFIMVLMNEGGQTYKYSGTIMRLSRIRTGNRRIDYHYMAQRLKQLKRDLKIDVSISFMEPFNFINVMSAVKERTIVSVRVHLTESIRWGECGMDQEVYYKWIPKLYNRASIVVPQTEEERDDLIKNYGVRPEKNRVIPNMIDPIEMWTELNESVSTLPHSIVLIGRMNRIKAQWHAIRAMKGVVDTVPDAELHILGYGDQYNNLQWLAKAMGLEGHIFFEGQVKNVKKWLRRSAVFLHTSAYEGFSNAILDAIFAGVPVIATDCLSSPRDILSPGTQYRGIFDSPEYAEYGILIPMPDMDEHNTSELLTNSERVAANAIVKILSDEKLKKHYSAASKERANDFLVETVIPRWIDCIEGEDHV